MEGLKQLSVLVRAISGLILLFALSEQPYSYYQVLRIVICGASIILIWYFIQAKIEWLGWLFIIPAILFNPIFPVYMDKSTWQLLDVLFAILFLGSLSAYNKERVIK